MCTFQERHPGLTLDSGEGRGLFNTIALFQLLGVLMSCTMTHGVAYEMHERDRLPVVESVRQVRNYRLNEEFMWDT